MSNRFLTVMEAIGKTAAHDIHIIWDDVIKYMPPATMLASLFFPQAQAGIGVVINSVDLIRQAVATVEQAFVAKGAPSGSGPEKLAQVLSIVSPVVVDLLTKEGINVNSNFVTKVVNAVVAILNVQQSTQPA